MDFQQFAHEYDLERLQQIAPAKQKFSMWVTPRFQQVYGADSYDEFATNLIGAFAQATELFIDVGAHYGFYSLLVATANPNCEIIAFEPVPENFEIIRQNLQLNNIQNVEVRNQAVSSARTRALFNISTASDNCAIIEHPATPVLRQIEVQLAPLSETLLAHAGKNTLIKIDTEGHELQALQGCEDILRANDNIQLFIEINPKCCRLAGAAPEALLQTLDALGYECWFLNDKNHQIYHFDDSGPEAFKSQVEALVENNSYINVMARKKGRSTNALFFCHSSALAGSERSMLELVRELIREHDTMCTVVMPSSGPLTDALKESGAGIVIAPMNWWCTGGDRPDDATIESLYQQSYYWIYSNLELLHKINPDVVVTNSSVLPWGALTAAIIKKPHIWRVSEFGGFGVDLKFYHPFEQVLDFIVEASDKVAPNSQAVQKALFPNPPDGKVQTIFTHIPAPKLEPGDGDAARPYYLLPDACRVILPGTVMPTKGQEDAVRSVIELVKNRGRRVELVIVGAAQPGYQYHLQSIIRAAGAEEYIHIHPFITDVVRVVSAADIVLVCSKIEALSRVMIEGMLLKKAVVASDTGGTAEIISDGDTGLLYSPGDYLQLADQIEKLIDNPDLLRRIGANAQAYATSKFTRECFGGEYYKIIREAVERPYQEKTGIGQYIGYQKGLLIKKLFAELQQRNNALNELNAQLDSQANAMTAQAAQAAAGMQAQAAQLQERNIQLQELEQQLQEHNAQLALREQRLQAIGAEMQELKGDLELTRAELLSYALSTSWRITRPLRKISAFLRGRK